MKIVSRPDEYPFGEGAFTLKMDIEELQFIGAVLYITRLGQGVYKEAAFKLMTTIEELFGEDFTAEAAADVDMHIQRLDSDGDTVLEQFPASDIALEV